MNSLRAFLRTCGHVTPVSRLNIVVEHVRSDNSGYNAFISERATGKRLFDQHGSHETMTESLVVLLEYTCLMVETQRENPENWRRQSATMVRHRLQQSPSPSVVDDRRQANGVSSVPPRGQKRNASVMESIENDQQFAGFLRLPGYHVTPSRREYQRKAIRSGSLRRPARDTISAAAICTLLPSTVSVGAKKMLYELLTRPQWPVLS
jgi:hypothetical protein